MFDAQGFISQYGNDLQDYFGDNYASRDASELQNIARALGVEGQFIPPPPPTFQTGSGKVGEPQFTYGDRQFMNLSDLQQQWDDAAYLAANPDIEASGWLSGDNPEWQNTLGLPGLTHFNRHGFKEGRDPFFTDSPLPLPDLAFSRPDVLETALRHDVGLPAGEGKETPLSLFDQLTVGNLLGGSLWGDNPFSTPIPGDAVNARQLEPQPFDSTFMDERPSFFNQMPSQPPMQNGIAQNWWEGDEFNMPELNVAPSQKFEYGLGDVKPKPIPGSIDINTPQGAQTYIGQNQGVSGIAPQLIADGVSAQIAGNTVPGNLGGLSLDGVGGFSAGDMVKGAGMLAPFPLSLLAGGVGAGLNTAAATKWAGNHGVDLPQGGVLDAFFSDWMPSGDNAKTIAGDWMGQLPPGMSPSEGFLVDPKIYSLFGDPETGARGSPDAELLSQPVAQTGSAFADLLSQASGSAFSAGIPNYSGSFFSPVINPQISNPEIIAPAAAIPQSFGRF